ncbi:zinc finger protein AEBP2 [Hetaerina americana]|uniref:zinc finger protein AEBP2 n=1 Tax=Hetaerina americana TaxID=62018 RepID=UPI003A7F46E7
MADEVFHEADREVVVDSKMAENSMEVLDIMRKECVNTKGLCGMKSKFYLSGESENYGAKFRVNGVGLRVHASENCDEHVSEFSTDFKSLCSNGDDSVRKKRCTDRYDSSESSDSGVAALSSTDCSTSSGNSDITEPGSPYSSPSSSSALLRSPASSAAASDESDDSRTGSPPVVVPEAAVAAPPPDEAPPPDPWLPGNWVDDAGGGGGVVGGKRLFSSGAFKRAGSYQGHFQSVNQGFQGKKVAKEAEEVKPPPPAPRAFHHHHHHQQQGKITEYFKAQMKPPGVRKERLGAVLGRGAAAAAGAQVAAGGKGGLQQLKGGQRVEALLVDEEEEEEYYGGGGGGGRADEEEEGAKAPGPPGGPPAAVVSSMGAPLSPILSVPKTLRFPVSSDGKALGQHSSEGGGSGSAAGRPSAVCHWSECQLAFECGTKLMEHLQSKHVNSQVEGSENFVCLWVGCKVYARTSCSRSWLERHVLSHGGNKPFRCIFDGCGQRFSSQTMLERHVNGHFNAANGSQGSCTGGIGGNAGAKRSLDTTPNRPFRRNGKKLRYRRRPWSARMFDYFDAGVMEELQHRLVAVTEKELTGQVTSRGDEVLLTSKVLARRTELDGTTKVLLRWYPEDILPDEWVSEGDVTPRRTFPIRTLPPSAHCSLRAALFGTAAPKHRRKTKAPPKQPSLPPSPLSWSSATSSLS